MHRCKGKLYIKLKLASAIFVQPELKAEGKVYTVSKTTQDSIIEALTVVEEPEITTGKSLLVSAGFFLSSGSDTTLDELSLRHRNHFLAGPQSVHFDESKNHSDDQDARGVDCVSVEPAVKNASDSQSQREEHELMSLPTQPQEPCSWGRPWLSTGAGPHVNIQSTAPPKMIHEVDVGCSISSDRRGGGDSDCKDGGDGATEYSSSSFEAARLKFGGTGGAKSSRAFEGARRAFGAPLKSQSSATLENPTPSFALDRGVNVASPSSSSISSASSVPTQPPPAEGGQTAKREGSNVNLHSVENCGGGVKGTDDGWPQAGRLQNQEDAHVLSTPSKHSCVPRDNDATSDQLSSFFASPAMSPDSRSPTARDTLNSLLQHL
jgi:hypothetical protein